MSYYYAEVNALPHPRTQETYAKVHREFTVRKETYFTSFGVTEEDMIDTCESRIVQD